MTIRIELGRCAIALALLLPLPSCYARTIPLDPLVEHAQPPGADAASTAPLPLVVGVRAAQSGTQVPGIDSQRVVERFASELSSAQLFRAVVYPMSDLAHLSPDLVLDVTVASSMNLHEVENLAKDVAVGISVLLLQPVLPTTYDLRVEIGAQILSRSGRTIASYTQAPSLRFKSNWISPNQEARAQWREEAVARAVAAVVNDMAAGRAKLRAAAEQP